MNPDKRALLLKRRIGTTKGEWGIPSGGIGKDELPIVAALRELCEETNIKLKTEQLKEIKTVTFFHQNDKTDLTITYLAYPVITKLIKLGNEHSEFMWLSLREYNTKSIRMHKETRTQLKAAYDYIVQYET